MGRLLDKFCWLAFKVRVSGRYLARIFKALGLGV